MEDLKALFKVRDEHFSKHTTKILMEITNTLECVTTYLVDIDDGVAQSDIVWEDISIMEDILVMMGTVDYIIGNTISFGNEKIVVTAENCESLQQLVHMSVPLVLVQEDDTAKIMRYLETTAVDMGSDLDGFVVPLTPQTTTPHTSDFDLSELSEEQRQSLKLSTTKGGQ